MKLQKYRVRKFRSVQDSGWIALDQVNALYNYPQKLDQVLSDINAGK
jgi:hypothetical protein